MEEGTRMLIIYNASIVTHSHINGVLLTVLALEYCDMEVQGRCMLTLALDWLE